MRRHNVVQYCKSAMVVLRFTELCIIACMGGMLYKSTTVHTEQCGGVEFKEKWCIQWFNNPFSHHCVSSTMVHRTVHGGVQGAMVRGSQTGGLLCTIVPFNKIPLITKGKLKKKQNVFILNKKQWKMWTLGQERFVDICTIFTIFQRLSKEIWRRKMKNANLESGELENCLQTLLQML